MQGLTAFCLAIEPADVDIGIIGRKSLSLSLQFKIVKLILGLLSLVILFKFQLFLTLFVLQITS